jgi:uncharacterized protein (DUF2249 family)
MNPSSPSIDLTHFDVRAIPCRIKHGLIFQRWYDLPVGGHFVLINDHDPVPLRYQFAGQFPDAFAWDYLENGPDEFHVKITKLAPVAIPPPPTRAPAPAPGAATAGPVQQIDVRGLEPPEPLHRILGAMESLPVGVRLRALTDREPCHLFGEAGQRGFRHACTEQPDHSWVTLLDRV